MSSIFRRSQTKSILLLCFYSISMSKYATHMKTFSRLNKKDFINIRLEHNMSQKKKFKTNAMF